MNYPFYLKLIKPKSRVRITLIYEHKELGKTVSLMLDGSVKLTSRASEDPNHYKSVIIIDGSLTNPEIGEGVLPYKFEGLDFKSALDTDDQKFIRLLAQHPNIRCDYPELLEFETPGRDGKAKRLVKKEGAVPYFELVIPDYVIASKVSNVKQRAVVSNHFLALSDDDVAKVCWMFEVDPRDKTEDEIIDIMIGDTGVLFQTVFEDGVEVKNSDVYMSKFIKSGALNDSAMSRIFAIKQAMEISKLEQHPFEYKDGNFYSGNTYLGGNIDQLQAFFANNERLYDALVGNRFEDAPKDAKRRGGRPKASESAE